MKFILWFLLIVFLAWFASFSAIKYYELGCAEDYNICVEETLVWLRRLILLEWASKWQTLLAGIFALSGGVATVYAAKIALSASEKREQQRTRDIIITNASYLAELFRQAIYFISINPADVDLSRWDDMPTSIKTLSPTYPKFTSDLFYLYGLVLDYSKGQSAPLIMSQLRGTAIIANFVLDDIVNFYVTGGDQYPQRPIKATKALIKSLTDEELTLKSCSNDADLMRVVRPMNNYVNFKDTKFYRAPKA